MERRWSSEKGSPLIDEGTRHKQPHAHAEKHKITPSVRIQVMIMCYSMSETANPPTTLRFRNIHNGVIKSRNNL